MRIAWGSLLLALLCLTIPAAAQFSGEVTGTVTDASGAVVSGATVRVVNSGTGEERTTQANDQGQYTIPNLAVAPTRCMSHTPALARLSRRMWICTSPPFQL